MPPTIVTIVTKREDSNDSSTEDQYTYYRMENKLRDQIGLLFSIELTICLLIFIPTFVLFPSIWMKVFCSISLLTVASHYMMTSKLHPESVLWYNFASCFLTTVRCVSYISSIINYSYIMIYSRNLMNKDRIFESLTEDINALAFNLAEITCLIISIIIFVKEVKLVNLYKRFIRFMEEFKTENIIETYNVTDNLLILS